jgi:hypothetical protein
MNKSSVEVKKLDSLVLKQAVRDLASKDVDLSNQAEDFFYSDDFKKLCHRLNIDIKAMQKSIRDLVEYPVISKKKIANDIARMIDKSFMHLDNY